MSGTPRTQRLTKMSAEILQQKKQNTGISKAKIIEYALINMPYITKKDVKK